MTIQTEAPASAGIAYIAHQYTLNSDLVSRSIADIAPDKWFTQPCPESNHLMWVTGHALNTRSGVVLRLLGGQSKSYSDDLFKRGGKLVEPGKYPRPEEIRAAWTEVAKELANAFSKVSETTLAQPTPENNAPTLDGTVSGLIAFFALHETYHVGQIGYLRKFLGYSQLVG
ncbi:MAG TPA: DinB family protein [Terriglobales bacterium]